MAAVTDAELLRFAAEIPTLTHWSGISAWRAKLFAVAGVLGITPYMEWNPQRFSGYEFDHPDHEAWKAKNELAERLILASTAIHGSDEYHHPESQYSPGGGAVCLMKGILEQLKHQEISFYLECYKVSQSLPCDAAINDRSMILHAQRIEFTRQAVARYDSERPGTAFKILLFAQLWPSRYWSDAERCYDAVERIVKDAKLDPRKLSSF